MQNLHAMLIEVASSRAFGRSEAPNNLTSLSTSCLISLSVARGEAELILNAVTSLIMSPSALSDQYIQVKYQTNNLTDLKLIYKLLLFIFKRNTIIWQIKILRFVPSLTLISIHSQCFQIPSNLTSLQRSVQSVILGPPARNQWLNFGVPHQSLVMSFPVDLPAQVISGAGELVVRSLVSDGCFLYVFSSKGLLKIGTGYGSSIRQHVYLHKPDFFAGDRHGWLGHCQVRFRFHTICGDDVHC